MARALDFAVTVVGSMAVFALGGAYGYYRFQTTTPQAAANYQKAAAEYQAESMVAQRNLQSTMATLRRSQDDLKHAQAELVRLREEYHRLAENQALVEAASRAIDKKCAELRAEHSSSRMVAKNANQTPADKL